jgi:hypothetical protein
MKVPLLHKTVGTPVQLGELVRRQEICCEQLSKARIVVERVRPEESLIVLRMARQPSRKAPVPARFLLLDYEVRGGEVWIETDAVMVLPARKGDFPRDVPTVEDGGEG